MLIAPALADVRAALTAPEGARRGRIMPVYTKVPADLLTPVMAYLRLSNGAERGHESFLLESVNTGERVGRHSFLGVKPRDILRTGPGLPCEGDPLRHLEERMQPYNYVPVPELASVFTGGAVGYMAFDCIQHFEPKTRRALRDPLGIPECVMLLCDDVVIFDHVFQTVYCVSHVYVASEHDDIDTLYAACVVRVEALARTILQDATPLPAQPPIDATPREPQSNVGQEGYERFVTQLRQHILHGEIFQAVPSQRLSYPTQLHPFNCYRHLRRINPSPYMFYVDCGDAQLVGASPETLCQIVQGKVAVHAIAGTVRRGATPQEDAALGEALLQSPKDRAEHIMLVDLARNDVNRVCDPTTTRVESLMNVEKFSHVIHLTSRITGQLRPDRTKLDALRSIFPAGTVSGAPKIRAIELVSQLEQERRGVYAGAVGRIDYAKHDLDVCIAIRTMTFKDNTAYLQAGGGIVHDSVEEDEYIETMNKLAGNLRCLRQAEASYASPT